MKQGFVAAVLIILVFSLAACNFPLVRGNSDSEMKTAVAMDVALTQLAATLTASAPGTAPTTEITTAVPEVVLPSNTPPPTLTPTLAGVWLTVLENTNCRSGPAPVYDWIALISAGQMAEAVARNPVNDYFYVRLPNSSNTYCWLWSKYSSITGNIATLPVFTPQPTPTPKVTPTPTLAPADFTLSYIGVENCAPQYAVRLKITNTGSTTWQSLKIVILDTATSTTFTHTNDEFKGVSGCTFGEVQGDLAHGEYSYIANVNPGQFDYDPAGHALQITITVYSNNGLTGTSLSKSITVTP